MTSCPTHWKKRKKKKRHELIKVQMNANVKLIVQIHSRIEEMPVFVSSSKHPGVQIWQQLIEQ